MDNTIKNRLRGDIFKFTHKNFWKFGSQLSWYNPDGQPVGAVQVKYPGGNEFSFSEIFSKVVVCGHNAAHKDKISVYLDLNRV